MAKAEKRVEMVSTRMVRLELTEREAEALHAVTL